MSPRIYCDGNPSTVAYVIDGGGSGYTYIGEGHTDMEAEYLAIIFGLNEFFIKWNKELDSRQDDIDYHKARTTGEVEFGKVATPSAETPRPLPPPILICSDNEVVVNQLSRQWHVKEERLRKLAQRVWQMTSNLDVKYQWVRRAENLAGKMLK